MNIFKIVIILHHLYLLISITISDVIKTIDHITPKIFNYELDISM